jgi:hypothetical protein
MIVTASLEQQVQALQLQVPPSPAPAVELDAVLDINEE